MMGTVIPTVCGNYSGRIRKSKLLAVHALGYLLGAIAAGATVSLLGRLVFMLFSAKPTAVFVFTVLGIVSLLYGAHELALLRLPVPQSRHQVPQKWRGQLRPPLMVFLYGLGLGPGFFTAIPVASFYVMVIAVFLQADPLYGVLAFTFYGVGRVAPLILIYWISKRRGRVINLAQVVYPWKPLVHVCNGLTLAAGGAGLIVQTLVATGQNGFGS